MRYTHFAVYSKVFKPFLTFIAFYCLIGQANALPTERDSIDYNVKILDHPRLLLKNTDATALKKVIRRNETAKRIHQEIIRNCDTLLRQPVTQRQVIGRRLLSVSREALRRIFYLSYAYRITGRDDYLKRAEKELLAIAAFKDWNPAHFLDAAELTMAAAIGYDWLYHDLPENSRQLIKEVIIKKGLKPSFDKRYNGWLQATHNWNQVCNAGMAYGALAIFEDNPEWSTRIINRAIHTIHLPMSEYKPDGAYPEGFSYWDYGTSFNVLLISALEGVFRTDFGISNAPGFMKTAGYMLNMVGPGGTGFNYSDSGLGGDIKPAMYWFANKLNDPSLLWNERKILNESSWHTREHSRILPALLIWNKKNLHKASKPECKIWVGNGPNPVALMRSSWTDTSAIYVGFKGGSPSVNHGHMDIGSFIMEADGVRWAVDLGSQGYNSLESKGLKIWGKTQDAQRWEVFRYNNFAHSTLTVNNELQRVAGYAPVISSSGCSQFMYAICDLSSVYKDQLDRIERGIAIVDKKYVIVRDEFKAPPKQTTIRWAMLTAASVKIIDNNRAELTSEGKRMILKVNNPHIRLKTWSTNPPRDYDAPNPGTTLLGFETIIPANSSGSFDVFLIPGEDGRNIETEVKPLSKWNN